MESGEFEHFPHNEMTKPSKQCLIFRNRFILPIEIEEIIIKHYNQIRSVYIENIMSGLSTRTLINELLKRDHDSDGHYYHRMYKTYSREMRRLYGIPHEDTDLTYAEQRGHGPVNMSINYNRLSSDKIYHIDVYDKFDVYDVIEEILHRRGNLPKEEYGRYVIDFFDHRVQNEWYNKTERERREYIMKLFPTIKYNFIKDYGMVSLINQRDNFEDVIYRTMRIECINRIDTNEEG